MNTLVDKMDNSIQNKQEISRKYMKTIAIDNKNNSNESHAYL